MRALLSVYDKTGLEPFASGLASLGVELVASGGTAEALGAAHLEHRTVEELTGLPSILGGRVKTLHPALHAGILADRDVPDHLDDLARAGVTPIDLVVVNLYPFRSNPSIELIDVGGPTMVRAAAKNHAHVGVVVDPADYDAVLDELRANGSLRAETRAKLARKAFAHTAAYDAAIVAWFDDTAADALPESLHLTLERAAPLRYGENPHQRGARYRLEGHRTFWDDAVQHAGTELSYLNLFDADAAWRLADELAGDTGQSAVVIVKHANACGAAVAPSLADAYRRALSADELSAFGGIVAITGELDGELADVVAAGPQADVIVATSMTTEAIATLVARRKATRLLSCPRPTPPTVSVRTIGDAFLVQDPDALGATAPQWRIATKRAPSSEELADLVVAWRVCARTSSNAVVLAKDGTAVGIGAGQQSRVAAAELAVARAGDRAKGSVGASDAFFPFADGLTTLIDAGVTAVVQPGGSVRDADMVEVADQAGIAMLLTDERHFRH